MVGKAMLLKVINHLVWADWERKHRRATWSARRQAPARILYQSQWDAMVREIFDQFGQVEQYKASQIVQIILKHSRER